MYTLDANILIRFSQNLPRDIFPGPWDALEDLAADHRVCICQMVLDEVARGGDDLAKWAKGLDGFVCDHSANEPLTVAKIGTAHPGWVSDTRNEADPWVIAHALDEGRIIVTDEKRAGIGVTDAKQKIPNVADEHGVKAINFFTFAREEGWKF